MDVIDVLDNCLYFAVGGVFAFDDLDLSLATIYKDCKVFNEFPLCVKGVSDYPDEVQFLMSGSFVVGVGRSRV